jgi:hypothetical protein
LSELLRLLCSGASQTIANHNNNEISPFIVICNEKRIAFAMYRPDQVLEENYPFKKGRTYEDTYFGRPITYRDTPNFLGIIGLIVTS